MDWEVRGGWSISIRTKQRFLVRMLMLQPTLPHNISSICPEGYARVVLQSPVGHYLTLNPVCGAPGTTVSQKT